MPKNVQTLSNKTSLLKFTLKCGLDAPFSDNTGPPIITNSPTENKF